jgi:hypothetical protein
VSKSEPLSTGRARPSAGTAIPAWPYGRDWGYYPSSALTVALLILLALVLTGRL